MQNVECRMQNWRDVLRHCDEKTIDMVRIEVTRFASRRRGKERYYKCSSHQKITDGGYIAYNVSLPN